MSGQSDREKREQLIEQLCFGMIFGEDRAGATRLVDEYVHALAERQRKAAEDWAADGYTAEADGLQQGADLIDPAPRLLACGMCYEEQGEEVHPYPECTVSTSGSP